MVPRWLFRLVQSFLLVLKVLYWQLFVTFIMLGKLFFGSTEYQPKLKKVPRRVALCLDTEKSGSKILHNQKQMTRHEFDKLMEKCALAVVWCFDAGVDDVTIYENSGILGQSIDIFAARLEKRMARRNRRLIFGHLDRVQRIKLFENGNSKESGVVELQSIEHATEEVSVRFLSSKDSEEDVARVAQELVDEQDIQPERITEKLLNSRFSATRGNPSQLSLILTYSISPNLLGFPPWLMRTPEILNIGESIISASYASFVWAMFKYSKTEQRWGR